MMMVCRLLSLAIPFEIESDTSRVFSIIRVNRISKDCWRAPPWDCFFSPPSITGGHFSGIAMLKSLNGGSTI